MNALPTIQELTAQLSAEPLNRVEPVLRDLLKKYEPNQDYLTELIEFICPDELRLEILKAVTQHFHHHSQYEKALHPGKELVSLAEKLNSMASLLKARIQLGVVYWNLGFYPQALEQYLGALRMTGEMDDESSSRARILNNIGIVYEKIKDWHHALEYYHKSLEIKKKRNDQPGISSTLINIGNVHLATEQFEEALTHYDAAAKIKQEINDWKGIANVLNNIGKIHFQLGELEEAERYFKSSLELKRKMKSPAGLVNTLNNLAEVAIARRQFDPAERLMDEAMTIARQSASQTLLNQCWKVRNAFHESRGEYEEALASNKKVNDLNLAIFDSQYSQRIAEMQTLYDVDRKVMELELARQEARVSEQKAEIYRLRNIELAQANQRLEKSREEIVELTRRNTALAMAVTASHDINQPLMILSGNLEMLRESFRDINLSDTQKRMVDRLFEAIRRIETILEQYRNVQRITIAPYSGNTDMAILDGDGD